MTNYESAINLLMTATNVSKWNELRAFVKPTLKIEEMNKIDSSGLIVQVLGPDKYIHYQ